MAQKIGKKEQQYRDLYKTLCETKYRYLKKYGVNGSIIWREK